MKNSTTFVCIAIALCGLFVSCSNSSEPLQEIAGIYSEMAENDKKVSDAFQSVYHADKNEQQSLQNKAIELSNEMKAKNEKLALKAAEYGASLLGTEIPCKSGGTMDIAIEKAVFSTVNAQDKTCNIVITVSCSEPSAKPYCLMMDKDNNILCKTPSAYSNGSLNINFRITRNSQQAETYARLNHIMVVTEDEYKNNSIDEENSGSDMKSQPKESEENLQGDSSSPNNVSANTSTGEIKIGDNLKSALESANKVTYEYNADSGIWATVGNVAIIIDESQLNQQGIDFIAAIPSDIAPDIAFKSDFVKSDAKILKIESL